MKARLEALRVLLLLGLGLCKGLESEIFGGTLTLRTMSPPLCL